MNEVMGTAIGAAAWRVTCAETVAALNELEAAWTALESSIPAVLPFATFDWTAAWWTHLRRRGLRARDRLALYAVWDPSGRLVAVAPMTRTSSPGGPLPLLRVTQPLGADPNVTEVRGLLAAAADVPHVLRVLTDHLAGAPHGVDWITWGGLRAEAIAALDPSLSARAVREREFSMFLVDLPRTWEELRAGLSRNMKEALRKCASTLRRDDVEWRFVALDRPDDIDARLARFRELHQARSAAPGMVPHPDYFAREEVFSFLRDVVRRRAARGAARLFGIEVGGELVAARLAFASRGELYLYFSGFAPEWGRYSIATTLAAEIVKYAIEQGFATVNLSTGRDASKMRWKPREEVLREISMLSDRLGAKARYRLFRAARRMRERRVAARLQAATGGDAGAAADAAVGAAAGAAADAADTPNG